MSDSADTSSFQAAGGQPADGPAPADYARPTSAYEPGMASESDRPEVAVGAAFAGGFLAALILKRIAS